MPNIVSASSGDEYYDVLNPQHSPINNQRNLVDIACRGFGID
ncbi:hypothetical protein LP43_0170 [Methylophaga thiooxydans]|uniref:Uncharacterized protein n=1 Tax=Methylophaga thiooxydans TaxID=392484 RepID=A0A0A0BL04_9GAMM|nr:hypothetical protein LP43_0170 [Methylophaga thiooxydans]